MTIKAETIAKMNNAEVDLILNSLAAKLRNLSASKKQFISEAAEQMASVIPKEDIALELLGGLKARNFRIDKSYIYRILKDKWPEMSGHIPQVDYNEEIEEDSEKVAAAHNIDPAKEVPKKLDYRKLKEELDTVKKERDQYFNDAADATAGFRAYKITVEFLRVAVKNAVEKNLQYVYLTLKGETLIGFLEQKPESEDQAYELIAHP